MRSKVLVIVLVVALVMLATPVMAVSPKKIPVIGTQMGGGISDGPDSWEFLTKGGIDQNRLHVGAGKITLNIPGQDPLVGDSSSIINFMQNTKTGNWIFHLEMTWTFPKGTFEGNDKMKMDATTAREAHMVMHGTGDYEGWVLTLTGTAPPMIWEGSLLIP